MKLKIEKSLHIIESLNEEGADIKDRLLAAGLGLTDDDLRNHFSDLYINILPGVEEWLKSNGVSYKYFYSQKGSNWNGAGKRCIEVPFGFGIEKWQNAEKEELRKRVEANKRR